MDFPFYMVAPFVNNSDDFDTPSRVEKTKALIDYICQVTECSYFSPIIRAIIEFPKSK